MVKKKKLIILIALLIVALGLVFIIKLKPEAPVIDAFNITESGKNRIVWSETDRASYYRVYRAKSKNGRYTRIKSTSALSYTDNDSVAGENYYYFVKAVSLTKAESDQSNIKNLICKLSRPDITLSNIEKSGKIKVEWTASEGSEKYEVYRADGEAEDFRLIKTTTEAFIKNISVKTGERYFYKVRAVCDNPEASSEFSLVGDAVCTLPQPELYFPKINSENNLRLSWSEVKGAAGYEIHRSENKDSGYTLIDSVKGEKFVDKTITKGTTYYYKIRAVANEDAVSSAFSECKDIKCLVSGGLTIGVMFGEDCVPTLICRRFEGASAYKIYRSFYSDKDFFLLSSKSIPRYTNQTIPKGLTLYYKINVTDASGKSIAKSDVIYVTTPYNEEENLKTCYLKQNITNLYSLPLSASTPTRVRYMEKLELGNAILSRPNGIWYRAFYEDKLYYLWCESPENLLTDKKSSFKYKGNTVYQQEVIDLALDMAFNRKTVFAHTDTPGIPDNNGVYSFDCSGFVKYVFNSVMQKYNPAYSISADVEKLYATKSVCNAGYKGEYNAKSISIDNLQPGDILFFRSLIKNDSDEGIKHIGIYLGNNEFVHCTSTWEDSVCIISLTGNYLENFVGACRYLPESVEPANVKATVSGPFKKHRVYAEKSGKADVIDTLKNGEKVTVLYTDSEKWAYIETASDVKGLIFLKYLKTSQN